jgi:hypothetical protein
MSELYCVVKTDLAEFAFGRGGTVQLLTSIQSSPGCHRMSNTVKLLTSVAVFVGLYGLTGNSVAMTTENSLAHGAGVPVLLLDSTACTSGQSQYGKRTDGLHDARNARMPADDAEDTVSVTRAEAVNGLQPGEVSASMVHVMDPSGNEVTISTIQASNDKDEPLPSLFKEYNLLEKADKAKFESDQRISDKGPKMQTDKFVRFHDRIRKNSNR